MRAAWLMRILGGVGIVAREVGRLPVHSADAERLYRELRRTASGEPPRVAHQAGIRADGALHPSGESVPSGGALSIA